MSEKVKINNKKFESLKHTNIIRLLSTLNKYEFNLLVRWVDSPAHNLREDLKVYIKYLKKIHPKFEDKHLQKGEIFEILYPDKKYNDSTIRRLNNMLIDIIEEFISYLKFRQDSYLHNKLILDHYVKSNDFKLTDKQFEKVSEILEKTKSKDSEYHQRKTELLEIERSYKLKNDPTYKSIGYESQISHTVKYFLESVMRLYGFSEYEKYFFNKKYDAELKEEVLKIIESKDYLNDLKLHIYYRIIKLYESEEINNKIIEVKNLILNNLDNFSREESFNLFIHLFNGININKLKTNFDFSEIEFEITMNMIENNLIEFNGVIDAGWFRGLFFKIYNARKYDVAKWYLDTYKNKINSEDKESISNHLNALISFGLKNYDEALKYLEMASYNGINDKWLVKNLFLKIYFETGEYERFNYVADSIRHLIKDNNVWNENITSPIRNFINLTDRVFKIKIGDRSEDLDEIKDKIGKTEMIGRNWLLEKTEELRREKNGDESEGSRHDGI
ncbi:MAG: hypothetical protein IAE65_08330 [Ignavibacteria bacterium]|nr:hypothetical protein [Ignavibacteria bacterium]